jgi:hypothetical protein
VKRLVIRVCGSRHPPYRVKIGPGTKTFDVLSHLKLGEDYIISPLSDPQKQFSPEEELYGEISLPDTF